MPHSHRTAVLVLIAFSACQGGGQIQFVRDTPGRAEAVKHCEDAVGPPHIENPAPDVYVAVGYDLANTILIRTPEGNVVVDVSMSPKRAKEVRAALEEKAPGPVKAIIYTHSHIDHIGGASVWAGPETEIWSTGHFQEHLIKQYGLFREAESRRGARQFGRRASFEPDAIPCSALGRSLDFDAVIESGIRMPTRTFNGEAEFTLGGVTFKLVEAHGETHDQLFVWLEDRSALLVGDNYYEAFPNLYTIRGTQARPVDEWIASLDAMRRLDPEVLIPSHTKPLKGRETIRKALTDYRDGVQWVRDSVVRGANRGEPLERIVEQAALPPHLASQPALRELYGQVDWSARAIYGNAMGWFDGRPETLYPLPAPETARREIAAMGGAAKVMQMAADAAASDPAWALHLLGKMEQAALLDGADTDRMKALKAQALRAQAAGVANTNGRSYLVESAIELEKGMEPLPQPKLDDAFLKDLPLETIFDIMATRVFPSETMDRHECVRFDFTDEGKSVWLTIRRGVAEASWGTPLPGTPEPLATVKTDAMTWRKLALKMESPAGAVASGRLSVEGGWLDFVGFLGRFDRN